MKRQRTKLLRVAAVAVVTVLMICVAAAVSFAAQGKDDAKTPALSGDQWERIEKALSKIEKRLAEIEERLEMMEKDRGPGAIAFTPRRLFADELKLRELREKLLEKVPEFDVLKKVYGAPPLEKYGGIGATMSSEDDGPVIITEVMEAKPAHKAGLEPGDVILAVDGKNVEGADVAQVAHLIRGEPETEVVITVERDGKEKKIAITREQIGAAPMELFLAPKGEDFDFDFEFPDIEEEFVGIGVYLGTDDEGRPVIDGVMEGAPAEDAGLKAGDVILSVDGKSVGSTEDAIELIGRGKKSKQVTLTIERDGQTKHVTITRGLIKRSAAYQDFEFPTLDVYKDALKGQKEGMEAYKKALKLLKEKDLKLEGTPQGWVLHDHEDEDDDGDYDDNEDYDDDEDEDYDHEDFDGLVRKEIKVLSTRDGGTTRSLIIKVGPDGKAHTFELKGGEWAEHELGDINGCHGIKILSPGDDEGECIILRTLNGDDHEIIIDTEDQGLVRREVKMVAIGDKETTRSVIVKVGTDGKAHVVELNGGEWIERELDNGSGVKILRTDGDEGQCVILCGPDGGEGGKVIKVIGGDGSSRMEVRICPESGAPCTGKCMTTGTQSRSWLDRQNPCDAASPQFGVRRGSDGCDCACGEADPAPSAMSCTMECCAGACASGASCNFFRSISDSGEVIILCRPKGSLTVCEPGNGCCPN